MGTSKIKRFNNMGEDNFTLQKKNPDYPEHSS